MPNLNFAELRQILLDLGFQMSTVPESHFQFDLAPARARIILDYFADGEPVDAGTLAVVRRNLDERGILSRARFDELLRQRALAG